MATYDGMIRTTALDAAMPGFRAMLEGALRLDEEDELVHAVKVTLDRLLARPSLLAGATVQQPTRGYSRNLLFACPDGRFSLWAMCWSPGAATPIHDHRCWCVFGILEGLLVERQYDIVGAPHGPALARERWFTVHGPGAATGLRRGRSGVHRMENRSNRKAVSLHAYGYDPRRAASSIDQVFEEFREPVLA